jgi:hypothetical protein
MEMQRRELQEVTSAGLFDLTSIAITRDGRLLVTCNPAGREATLAAGSIGASARPFILSSKYR